MFSRFALFAFSFAAVLPVTVGAATHSVPGDFARITDALAAASAGDTVSVGPGTYSTSTNGEAFPLVINKSNIVLRGAGMLFTTVHAEGQSTVIRTFNPGIRITDLEITGGAAANGGGIAILATDTKVDRCLVRRNSATAGGAGLFGGSGSAPWVRRCVFWENSDGDTTDTMDPHGIRVFQGNGRVEHTIVGKQDGNGIIFGAGANVEIVHCILIANAGRGACALGDSASAYVIVHNLFWNNGIASLLFRTPSNTVNFTAQQANDYDPADSVYGNIDADPLFMGPENGNWHLQAASPAIDGGDPAWPLDPDGTIADIGPFYYDQVVGIGDDGQLTLLPLMQAYTNPFSREVTIGLMTLEKPMTATVAVFDSQGRLVQTLARNTEISSRESLAWNGKNANGRAVPPGVYFLRLQSADGKFQQTAKLVRQP
jgi:hypothetical protein